MTIGKDEVVEVLADLRIRSIRFSAGPIHVNVDEYNRVADFIDTGAIEVKSTKQSFNHYIPERNTLFMKDGDSRNDFDVRSGVLHECTHIIADINKVRISRLHDEAVAYLAQYSFYKLLDPTEVVLIMGNPSHDLMRVGLNLVKKYGLGQPKGFGAIISPSDIDTLGRLVQRIPDYSHIKEKEQLSADGVDLTVNQMVAHHANEMARLADKIKYQNWLLSTVNAAQTGSGAQKSSAYQQLRQHFFVVYQPVATVLLHRLSAVKKGDPLSERFDSAFTAQEKFQLLDALRAPKPPG
jgi:hypothetical protein